MSKQFILEAKRMQKLAGIINEAEENQEPSPEQAAAQVAKTVGKLEQSPVLDKIASDIANDPKALQQLQGLHSQFLYLQHLQFLSVQSQSFHEVLLSI
jgi:hypothetical protein